MLMLKVNDGEKVNLYLRTEHGERLLGSIVAKPKSRIGFDLCDEVHVLREKADEKRLEQPECAK